MGLICDAALFDLLETSGAELIASGFRSPEPAASDVLMRAEVTMMRELSANLYEHELARLVDFGHSFSPVIEVASNFEVAHGEAVALDMLLATAIAAGRALCDDSLVVRLIRLYRNIELPVTHATMSPLLMERALTDARAHRGGALNLVVPAGIGSARFLQDVAYDEIVRALDVIAVYR